MNKKIEYEMNIRHKFVAIIENYRHSCKPVILYKEVAERMGLDPANVSQYISCRRHISDDHLAAMCIALRMPIRTQKQAYSVLERKMPDSDGFGDLREQIILRYMEHCEKSDEHTVRACNAELIENDYIPLTGKRGKRI